MKYENRNGFLRNTGSLLVSSRRSARSFAFESLSERRVSLIGSRRLAARTSL